MLLYAKLITQCVFFMGTKVFVHLTLLELPQISQTYIKLLVWSEHFIKNYLEYFEKQF